MKMTIEQIAESYHTLRSTPVEELRDEQVIRLFKKIAQESDLESFTEMVESGEVPPVQLTSEEMDAVKGGAGVQDSFRKHHQIGFMPPFDPNTAQKFGD